MTQRSPSRWDLCRFLRTLSFFDAVPIFGDLRWLQQWLGHDPDPATNQGIIASDTVSATSLASNSDLESAWLVGIHPQVEAHLIQVLQAQGIQVQSWQHLPEWLSRQNQTDDHLPDVLFLHAKAPSETATNRDGEFSENDSLTANLPQIESYLASRCDRPSRTQAKLVNSLKIVNFETAANDIQTMWGAVDDVVMGGVSESRIHLTGSSAVFSGVVSTANSGGFASVRTRTLDPPLDLSTFTGITFHVKGDGQRYKFLIRDDARWDGVAYSYSFDTDAEQWSTIQIPFAELIPVFRAKTRNDVGSLDTQHIRAFQLMLSKFEYDGALNPQFRPGPFQLQIKSIGTYTNHPTLRIVLLSHGQPSNCEDAIRAIARRLGLSYVIIQHGNLTQTPQAQRAILKQARKPDDVSPADLANLCVAALHQDPMFTQQSINSTLTVVQQLKT